MRASILLTFGLLACAPAPGTLSSRAYIAPAEGQTGVAGDVELLVVTGELEVPPDYDIGPIVRVVDVEGQKEVLGAVLAEDGAVRFIPDEPWLPDRRYLWTVETPWTVPHGPEIEFPDELVGTAVFDTSARLDVLGATLERTTEPCFLFSQSLSGRDIETIELYVEGQQIEPAEIYYADGTHWRDPYDLPSGDGGLDVVCMDLGETLLTPEQPVKLHWDEQRFVTQLDRRRPGEIVQELRRAVE